MTLMRETCGFCGRFLKHNWFQATDSPDSWEDYWSCSQDEKHKIDHPEAYGLTPVLPDSGASS